MLRRLIMGLRGEEVEERVRLKPDGTVRHSYFYRGRDLKPYGNRIPWWWL